VRASLDTGNDRPRPMRAPSDPSGRDLHILAERDSRDWCTAGEALSLEYPLGERRDGSLRDQARTRGTSHAQAFTLTCFRRWPAGHARGPVSRPAARGLAPGDSQLQVRRLRVLAPGPELRLYRSHGLEPDHPEGQVHGTGQRGLRSTVDADVPGLGHGL